MADFVSRWVSFVFDPDYIPRMAPAPAQTDTEEPAVVSVWKAIASQMHQMHRNENVDVASASSAPSSSVTPIPKRRSLKMQGREPNDGGKSNRQLWREARSHRATGVNKKKGGKHRDWYKRWHSQPTGR